MPIATCVFAQSSDVDLAGGQFVSVPDQPTFKACRGIHLGMELQAENMAADLEACCAICSVDARQIAPTGSS